MRQRELRPPSHGPSIASKVKALIVVVVASFAMALALFELAVDARIDGRRFPRDLRGPNGEPVRAMVTPIYVSTTRVTDFFKEVEPFGRCLPASVEVHTDRFGLRSSSPDRRYREGPTIALVGDSYTFGSEVEYSQTLQGLLEAERSQVQFINFGVSGSSSSYFAETVRAKLGLTGLRLDGLIVGLYIDMQLGDLPRTIAREAFGDSVVYDGVSISRSRYDEISSSGIERLAFWLEVELRRRLSSFNLVFPAAVRREFASSLRDSLDPRLFDELERRVLDGLTSLRSAASLPPGQTIVWLVPSNLEVKEKWLARREGRAPERFFELSREFWDRLVMRLRADGYLTVDPRGAIERLALEDGVPAFSCSGHFAPSAYRRLLDEMNAALDRLVAAPLLSELH